MTITCLSFKPCARGTLLGFARIRVAGWRLTIDGVAIHESSNGKQWAQLPSKPLLDDARELIRESDGKIRYAKIFEFTGHAAAGAFSRDVVTAVSAYLTKPKPQ